MIGRYMIVVAVQLQQGVIPGKYLRVTPPCADRALQPRTRRTCSFGPIPHCCPRDIDSLMLCAACQWEAFGAYMAVAPTSLPWT